MATNTKNKQLRSTAARGVHETPPPHATSSKRPSPPTAAEKVKESVVENVKSVKSGGAGVTILGILVILCVLSTGYLLTDKWTGPDDIRTNVVSLETGESLNDELDVELERTSKTTNAALTITTIKQGARTYKIHHPKGYKVVSLTKK